MITRAQLDAKRKGQPLPRPEREILAAILKYLALRRDVVVWRNNVGAVAEGQRFVRFGVKGLPDIVGHVARKYAPFATPLYIEVKAPGAALRPAQAAFLARALGDGCLAFVARSVEDVIAALPRQR